MEIRDYIVNGTLEVKVVPNASKNKVVIEDDHLKIYIKQVPDKNKANGELVKYLKKKFNLNVEIKSGLRSRNKLLGVLNG